MNIAFPDVHFVVFEYKEADEQDENGDYRLHVVQFPLVPEDGAMTPAHLVTSPFPNLRLAAIAAIEMAFQFVNEAMRVEVEPGDPRMN